MPKVLPRRVSNQLRIIGGQWRRKKLTFPDVAGLRPTPDRVRETLFNWLQPVIHGARCLDLFAGSGALGFEALSRGAQDVLMVERDARIIASLRQNSVALGTVNVRLLQGDALGFLQQTDQAQEDAGLKFNVVFLDPPFRHNLLEACSRLLEDSGWLHDQARIYLEAEGETPLASLPQNWRITHSKRAGQVSYCLAQRETPIVPTI